MSRVHRPVGAGTKETVVVVGVNVMGLHHPHQMHRIGAARKAPVSVVDVVADRLGAGEPLRAQSDRAGAMIVDKDAADSAARCLQNVEHLDNGLGRPDWRQLDREPPRNGPAI